MAAGGTARRPPAGRCRQTEARQRRQHLCAGSLSIARQLLGHGLVDRLRLLAYPGAVGQGKALFLSDKPLALELVSAAPFSNGVVALEYRPTGPRS